MTLFLTCGLIRALVTVMVCPLWKSCIEKVSDAMVEFREVFLVSMDRAQ